MVFICSFQLLNSSLSVFCVRVVFWLRFTPPSGLALGTSMSTSASFHGAIHSASMDSKFSPPDVRARTVPRRNVLAALMAACAVCTTMLVLVLVLVPVPAPSPARSVSPTQGTPSAQQSPAAAPVQKRPAASLPPSQQQRKRSRTDASATGSGSGTGTGTTMVVHAAQAAINTANTLRLGTVRARTSSGVSLDSMEAAWIRPWNDADVDMDVPNADPLGGVNLGQKTRRTQNALNELITSWNEQMKTTKVSSLPT